MRDWKTYAQLLKIDDQEMKLGDLKFNQIPDNWTLPFLQYSLWHCSYSLVRILVVNLHKFYTIKILAWSSTHRTKSMFGTDKLEWNVFVSRTVLSLSSTFFSHFLLAGEIIKVRCWRKSLSGETDDDAIYTERKEKNYLFKSQRTKETNGALQTLFFVLLYNQYLTFIYYQKFRKSQKIKYL